MKLFVHRYKERDSGAILVLVAPTRIHRPPTLSPIQQQAIKRILVGERDGEIRQRVFLFKIMWSVAAYVGQIPRSKSL